MHQHFIILMNTDLWWIGMFGTLIGLGVLIALGFYTRKRNIEPNFRIFLVALLVLRELFFYGYLFYFGEFNAADSLPLHLCGISYICSLFALYSLNIFLFEFLLLLGIGGAIQSILTPELTHGYSTYLYLDYYISHATIIFTPMYLFYVLGVRLRHKSYFRIWVLAHIILISVGLINVVLNSNYIYLCTPPKVDNPLITGGFPYHLIGFEIFGTLHILLFYYLFTKILAKSSPVVNTSEL